MPKCDFNKVASSFIEITLRHGCSPVNLPHSFRTPFTKTAASANMLLLNVITSYYVLSRLRHHIASLYGHV